MTLRPDNDMNDLINSMEWRKEPGLIPYDTALADMEARAAAIYAGTASERIWLVEHPPLYTAGTSANEADLIDPRFPVYEAGRGGKYTYHGPGQRVGYLNLDLSRHGKDIRHFVQQVESWVIAALADFDVAARTAPGRIGIWTDDPDGNEAKIGAIGVRVRHWVTLHGFSVNIAPDLSHFSGIIPCGISEYPVTSLARLGRAVSMEEFDAALRRHFPHFIAALQPLPDENAGSA